MVVALYLRELLQLFVRWWWAAVTGVASILSWWVVPKEGWQVGRLAISIGIFIALSAGFLLISVVVRSFTWFVERARPEVIRFSTAEAPPSFVVRALGEPLHAGFLLALFRRFGQDDVPVAILKVDEGDMEPNCVRCVSVWMSPIHQKDLASGKVDRRDLSVRRQIPERIWRNSGEDIA